MHLPYLVERIHLKAKFIFSEKYNFNPKNLLSVHKLFIAEESFKLVL